MARDQASDAVFRQRSADRTRSRRRTDGSSDVAVSGEETEGDPEKRLPNLDLKIRAGDPHPKRSIATAAPRKHMIDHRARPGLVPEKDCPVPEPLQIR